MQLHNSSPQLISDLGLALTISCPAIFLLKRFGITPALAYLAAGIFAGPHFPFLPTLVDHKSIQTWAELGIIFLFFSIGLEFKFQQLRRLGSQAILVATVEVAITALASYTAIRFFGWKHLPAIFLGVAVSISSTIVIVKTLTDFGLRKRTFAELIIAVLLVEDLIAIASLLILSSFAGLRTHELNLAQAGLKLVLFIALGSGLGLIIIPWLLRRFKKFMGDEPLLILSLSVCLIYVFLAVKTGFSLALGAFLAGAVFAETSFSHRISELLEPIKSLFTAFFFVSVGLLFDPSQAAQNLPLILTLGIIVLLVKGISTALAASITGSTFENGVRAGMGLGSVGEFSFVIATLAVQSKIALPEILHTCIGLSLMLSFIYPFWVKFAVPFGPKVAKALPANIRNFLLLLQGEQNKLSWNSDQIPASKPTVESQSKRPPRVYLKLRYRPVTRVLALIWQKLQALLTQNLREENRERVRHYRRFTPWEAHLANLPIPAHSKLAGQTLQSLKIREKFGANILVVERPSGSVVAPSAMELVLPLDQWVVLGTDDQIAQVEKWISKSAPDPIGVEEELALEYKLFLFPILEGSILTGQTIRESKLKERFQCLIVGIERSGKRFTNPVSDFKLQAEDQVWMVLPVQQMEGVQKFVSQIPASKERQNAEN